MGFSCKAFHLLLLFLVAFCECDKMFALNSVPISSELAFFPVIETLNPSSGSLDVIANVSSVGGVTGGHIWRTLSSSPSSFALLSLAQNASTTNFFSVISASGSVMSSFASSLPLLSMEVKNNDVFVICVQNPGVLPCVGTVRSPLFAQLSVQHVFEEEKGAVPAEGCSSLVNSSILTFVVARNDGSQTALLFDTETRNAVGKVALPSGLGTVVAMEASDAFVYFLTSTNSSGQVWRSDLSFSNFVLLVSLDSNFPSTLGASLLDQQNSIFYTVIGDSDGIVWKLAAVELSGEKSVSYVDLNGNMIVSLLPSP